MRLHPTGSIRSSDLHFSLSWSAWRWRERGLALAVLGGLSLLTYWVGLLLPYSLFAVGLWPAQSAATLTEARLAAQISLVLTTAALWSFYLLAWVVCRLPGRRAVAAPWPLWVAVLGTGLVAACSLVWLYPIGSTDIFDSMAYGRIVVAWHGNPFYQTISQYPDTLARYAGWPFATSAYGPLWVAVAVAATGLAQLVGGGLVASLILFKLIGLFFYCGCVGVVVVVLRRHAPERALAGTCLFALNPLVLVETVGNGHNDIVMAFCLLLMAAALSRGRHTWAALALTAGVLVKYVPMLLAPVLLAYSLRALPDRPARWRYLLITGLACGLLTLAAWAPFWRGGDIATIGRRTVMFTTSLPAFIETQLSWALGAALTRYHLSRAALVLMVLVAYAVSWHTWQRTAHAVSTAAGRQRAWLEPLRTSHMLLLFYLLVACLWFQPWYAIWPLALAVLLPESTVVYLALLLTYTSGWKSIYLDYFISPAHLGRPSAMQETFLGPAVMAFPWLYALLAVLRTLLARRSVGEQPRAPVAAPMRLPEN